MPVERGQVERWVHEDLGHHDVTNDVPGETVGRLVATEPGVVGGIDAARAVCSYLAVTCTPRVDAGDRVDEGAVVLEADGSTRDVLRCERLVANVVGHASGIATRTRRAVDAARAEREEVRVAATRKTTPGLRGLEKRAVAAGGGDTHRLDASHMVMVKDNHVAELGLEAAIERLRERASFVTRLEVEVEDVEDVPRAADAGADVVMLDNMTPAETRAGVERLPEDVRAEASGGISIEDLPDYARTGVDVISLGSLTHGAPALDVSFRTGDGGGD